MTPGTKGKESMCSIPGNPSEISSHLCEGVSDLALPGVTRTVENPTPLRMGAMQCLRFGLNVTYF